jgi:hypothetical protein
MRMREDETPSRMRAHSCVEGDAAANGRLDRRRPPAKGRVQVDHARIPPQRMQAAYDQCSDCSAWLAHDGLRCAVSSMGGSSLQRRADAATTVQRSATAGRYASAVQQQHILRALGEGKETQLKICRAGRKYTAAEGAHAPSQARSQRRAGVRSGMRTLTDALLQRLALKIISCSMQKKRRVKRPSPVAVTPSAERLDTAAEPPSSSAHAHACFAQL